MANYAVDFYIDLMPDTGEDLAYSFRFGKCDEFKQALNLVKSIPLRDRTYSPQDKHRWTIQAGVRNLEILCSAFDNFQSLYESAKAQPPLPGLGYDSRRKG